MQHLESAAPPVAHPSSARWVRVSAAVALCLAGPAVSFAGVLTTGLSGTAAAVRFPHGFGATLATTAVGTALAAALAALIARRDALGVIWAALGIWFTVGLGAGIAGIGLSHPGPAYWAKLSNPGLARWGVVVIVASITGIAAGLVVTARRGPAQNTSSPADHA